jgi:hypothetical protein
VTSKKPGSIRTPIAAGSGTGAIADKAGAKACLAIRAPLALVPLGKTPSIFARQAR